MREGLEKRLASTIHTHLKNFLGRIRGSRATYERLSERLEPGCDLELYLVMTGLKPAAEIDIFVKKCGERCKDCNWEWQPDEADKAEVESMLGKIGLEYIMKPHVSIRIPTFTKEMADWYEKHRGSGLHVYGANIARSRMGLSRLLAAADNRATGRAFGYPDEAIEAYADKHHCGMDLDRELLKYVESGKPLPIWLAYISFVPDRIPEPGDASESKAMGERFMRYVRRHNTKLARKVEEEFLFWNRIDNLRLRVTFESDVEGFLYKYIGILNPVYLKFLRDYFNFRYTCERCAKEWVPEDLSRLPEACPNCSSPYWNLPERYL